MASHETPPILGPNDAPPSPSPDITEGHGLIVLDDGDKLPTGQEPEPLMGPGDRESSEKK